MECSFNEVDMTNRKHKWTKPKKKVAVWSMTIGIIIGLCIPWIATYATSGDPYKLFEVISVKKNDDGSNTIVQQNVPYTVKVDFGDILLDQAQKEKKLIIYRQNAAVPVQAEKDGLFGWGIYSQAKSMLFHGVGTYSVDLAEIKDTDIIVDSETQIIEIHIPEPDLSIEYLPEETEFLNTTNGILRFGEMEVTPEMMTELETLVKERLRERIEADTSSIETARRFAALSVKEIFEPVLKKQIDSAVSAENSDYAIAPYYSIRVIVGNNDKEEIESES